MVEHLKKAFPAPGEHIQGSFGWQVQRLDAKINHSLALGGDPARDFGSVLLRLLPY